MDYTKDEIQDLLSNDFNIHSFCEKWKRGYTEIILKRENLINRMSHRIKNNFWLSAEDVEKVQYSGDRINKIIKNIFKNKNKNIKKKYTDVPNKNYVQSELFQHLKNINCSILTLLGPTPHRYLDILKKYNIVGDNEIYSYEYTPEVYNLYPKDIVEDENINLNHGNIQKAKPQKFIDLDLTGRWDTQINLIKNLFYKQESKIEGSKYFMLTLSLFGKESSEPKTAELIKYIKNILEELLSTKIDINTEIIKNEPNVTNVTKLNIKSEDPKYSILSYKYKDTSVMISTLIMYS